MFITLEVNVIPGASRQRIVLDPVCDIRCYVTAPAQDNKANHALIALLAVALGVPKKAVSVVAGQTARRKRLAIEGFTCKQEVFKALKLEVQCALF